MKWTQPTSICVWYLIKLISGRTTFTSFVKGDIGDKCTVIQRKIYGSYWDHMITKPHRDGIVIFSLWRGKGWNKLTYQLHLSSGICCILYYGQNWAKNPAVMVVTVSPLYGIVMVLFIVQNDGMCLILVGMPHDICKGAHDKYQIRSQYIPRNCSPDWKTQFVHI